MMSPVEIMAILVYPLIQVYLPGMRIVLPNTDQGLADGIPQATRTPDGPLGFKCGYTSGLGTNV